MAIEPWTVTASSVLVEDKWVRLRADECTTSDGKTIAPYYVFDYPSWVTVFPVTKQGELVLVRQYRHGLGEVLLELPCGGYEANEVDSVVAAARELSEETGYTGKSFDEIASFSPNPANHSNLSHVVICTDLERTQEQRLDPGERIEVVLMPLQTAIVELKKGNFVQAMHVAALFYGLSHLGLIE